MGGGVMYPSKLQQQFIIKYAGKKIHPMWKSYDISAYPMDQLKNSFHHFEKIQFKIINYLLKEKSPSEILQFFGVDERLLKFIQWPKHEFEYLYTHLRLDLVPTSGHNFKICEFNVDSALGGCDNFQLYRLENFEKSSIEGVDPYKSISKLIRSNLEVVNANKLVLLDWSSWKNSGHYNLEWFKKSMEFYIPGIDVLICDETNIEPHLEKTTIVYRIFTANDCLQNTDFIEKLFHSTGLVMNDFTGEIYSSKKWLSLFWDTNLWPLLSDSEIETIKMWIPITHQITKANAHDFIKNKNKFYFKGISDFGGKSVLYGSDKTEEELINFINQMSKVGVVAQEAIISEPLKVSSEKSGKHNAVFGMYRFGKEWVSSFLRSSETNNIVNVANGAMAGWAYEKQ